MKAKTLHINNPSPKLLEFVKTLREEKERNQEKLLSDKKNYF